MSNVDKLLKNDKNVEQDCQSSKKFGYSKRAMQRICKSLSIGTTEYCPSKTAKSIKHYNKEKEKIDRILYSEISNYIFTLTEEGRGVFASNIEKLLLYALENEDKVNEDSRKIIIKIYDHFQLALHQIENANNIFNNSVNDAKTNLEKQLKGIEKEYISILGIFAAVVLAFIGGITFSSSVLQNMMGVSVYRLLIVVDMLAFVLINVIYLLVKFIFKINEKEIKFFNIKSINTVCLIIAVIVVVCWLLNAQQLSQFFAEFLPWC